MRAKGKSDDAAQHPRHRAGANEAVISTKVSHDLQRMVVQLAEESGLSKAAFVNRAIEHEVQRITKTKPIQPLSIEQVLARLEGQLDQVRSLASQAERQAALAAIRLEALYMAVTGEGESPSSRSSF